MLQYELRCHCFVAGAPTDVQRALEAYLVGARSNPLLGPASGRQSDVNNAGV